MARKKLEYETARERDGQRWLARAVYFGVSLTIVTAVNELYTAHMMLRERRDFYRGKVKQLANMAERDARMQRERMMSLMPNRRFFDVFSDRAIDLAEDDIKKFRISIKQTLEDNGCPDSELFSYTETARSLLEAAKHHFNSVLATAAEDYSEELLNTTLQNRRIELERRWRKAFFEFDPTMVSKGWDRLCKTLYTPAQGCNLNTPLSEQLFDNILHHFVYEDYVEECMKEAKAAEPDFVMNKIVIKEEKEQ